MFRTKSRLSLGAFILCGQLCLAPLALADDGTGDVFTGDGEDDSITITVRRDPKPGRGRGDSVERPVDMSPGKRDAVTDGPRRVWVSAADPDLGCRSGGPDVFRVLAVTSFCRAVRAVCPSAFPGASVVVGREVEVSTGAPVLGTERVSGCSSLSSGSGGGGPVMPVVSQEDFRSLGVRPLVAHLGPPGQWIPVGIDMIVWAESGVQVFEVEMFGQSVRVRATPVKYVWDFGDGTVLTTSFPGRPHPSRDVSMRYVGQGWYEVSLVTVFSGEFSVAGGPWQPVQGTVEVASEKKWIYSDVRQSRLVGDEVPEEYVGIPERGADTLGPINPEAEKTVLLEPRKKRIRG
ncbi:hypothetical protein [Dermabacter hominis]|uniref:hypothetical protein n=2 Tax=Dermabacter hominis TaxID=36740 RepID=UPI00215134D3|nr:hypothetical protein CYJ49_000210 [Dermabacter hominis]